MIKIELLKNHPDYAPILAFWAYQEWYQQRSIPFDLVIKSYKGRARSEKIPITWIAVEDGIPVGMASLKENDIWSRKNLNPWLASLFVLPEYRKRGIGFMLINQVIEKSKLLQHPLLYLFTDHNNNRLERYYSKSGWLFLEKAKGNDENIINIFYYNLD
jgi:GNAT superfamily N-acetyltransferase